MKRIQRGLVITMAAAFLMTSTMVTTVMANGNQGSGILTAKADKVKDKDDAKNNDKVDSKENGKENDKEDSKANVKGKDKAWKIAKDILEEQKGLIEGQKDKLEEQKETLEKQYEAAKTSGDLELAKQIQTQIQKIKADMEALKQQMKVKRDEIKATIKSNYTNEELAMLKLVSDKIKKNNKNIDVLPVENIQVKGINVKFDTPPVIKSGRTLIPVNALVSAFGADVKWVAAERKVIITRGDIKIVLILDSNKIYVNGVEKTIDVPACSINSRTVVPISFIAHELGLKVNWHGDSKDVEIEDPTDPIPPINTTGSAIIVTGSAITAN